MGDLTVHAADKTFVVNTDDIGTVTGFKELSAIERAFGVELSKLRPLQQAGAMIWSLVKRQDPTVRIDDVDFDLGELPADEVAAAVDPTVSAATDSAT